MRTIPRFVPAGRLALLLSLGLVFVSSSVTLDARVAQAAPNCNSFTSKVYDQLNPTTTAQGLSATAEGWGDFQAQGFTANRAFALTAAPAPGSGLKAVHRLYRPSSRNYFYTFDAAEIARAKRYYGYRDQGVAFYASNLRSSCLQAVWSYLGPRGYHRFVTSASEQKQLTQLGWRREKIRFYLGRPSTASVFTLAVIPDTQQEVLRPNDGRFAGRVRWLVENKQALDLRFVTHTGDIVNWDTPDHAQYVRARQALAGLNGRIPYSLTIGNHDTAAVGPGGGAADPRNTRRLVRDTRSANRYLNEGTASLAGRFEPGKIDNAFHTFAAGGRNWLVLNLELWPRKTVVAWAQRVVASHPRHNVVVATHSYMTARGAIYNRSEYGETSPQYLFDNLIKRYPNVELVVAGHAGAANHRQDVGVKGNRINSILTTMHDVRTNPVRIVEINVKTNTVSAFIYSPHTRMTYTRYNLRSRKTAWTA